MKIIISIIFFLGFGLQTVLADTDTEEDEEKPEQIEATPKVSDYVQNLRDGVEEGRKEADNKNCKLVLEKLVSGVEQKEKFATIGKTGKSSVLYHLVECAVVTNDFELALVHTEDLVNVIKDSSFQLTRWFQLGRFLDKPKQAQKALSRIVSIDPSLLLKIKQRDLWQHWRQLKSMSDPQGQRFLMAGWLVNNNYIPPNKSYRPGAFHLHYAKGLMRKGQVKQAEKILSAYPSDDISHDVQSLKVFEPLWKKRGFSKKYDILTGLQSKIDWQLRASQDIPDHLRVIIGLMESYQYLGKLEQAKQLGVAALQKIDAAKLQDETAFTDLEEDHSWLLNQLAIIAGIQDETEQTISYYRQAINLDGQETPNVSQLINLSSYLTMLGQPEQALLEISKIIPENASNYGKAFVHYIRACSYAQTGDNIQMDFEISKLAAYKNDNPNVIGLALLCANRTDEAAAHYIGLLSSPEHKDQTLRAFFNYQPPINSSEWQLILQERLEKLAKRPDVQIAIAKVGRIIDVPFTSYSWGVI
ncbi:MAG: tetratricopeptide repeat protein [Robiginitomaculum sp.]|nr:tetratricopeptide repeat protein [Robiginitomaculum sp.]